MVKTDKQTGGKMQENILTIWAFLANQLCRLTISLALVRLVAVRANVSNLSSASSAVNMHFVLISLFPIYKFSFPESADTIFKSN